MANIFRLFTFLLFFFAGSFVFSQSKYIELYENNLNSLSKKEKLGLIKDFLADSSYSNPRASIEFARYIKYKISPNDSAYKKVEIYNALGTAYEHFPKADTAIYYYEKALAYADRINGKKFQTVVHNNLGTCHLRFGNIEKSEYHFNKAYSFAKDLGNKLYMASISTNLANIYEEKGEYAKALALLKTSIADYRDLGDRQKEAIGLGNVGNIYKKQGNLSAAKSYFLKGLKILDELNNHTEKARLLVNLGDLYLQNSVPDSSIAYLEKALNLSEQYGLIEQKARSYYNLGHAYSKNKNYEKAIEYFKKGLAITDEFRIDIGSAYTHLSLAHAYAYNKNNKLAKFHFNKLKTDYSQIKMFGLFEDTLEIKYKMALNDGQYEKAHGLLLKKKTLEDSLTEKVNSEKVLALQQGIELQEKQYENDLLKEQKALADARLKTRSIQTWVLFGGIMILLLFMWIVSTSRLRLKRINETLKEKQSEIEERNKRLRLEKERRERILKTVSHDFKNQIFNIQGLRNLLEDDAEQFSESQKKVLQMMKDSSNKGLEIIEELSVEREFMSFTTLKLSELISKIAAAYKSRSEFKNIRISVNLEEDLTVFSNEKGLHRILSNLLSNALKFSNENTNVSINGKKTENGVILDLVDEGQGFKKSEINKIFSPYQSFSSQPAKGESSTGIGLSIVKEIADKLNIEIKATSKFGVGTTFTLIFKQKPAA